MQNDIVRQQPKSADEPTKPMEQFEPVAIAAPEPVVETTASDDQPAITKPKTADPTAVILFAAVVCLVLVTATIYSGMRQTG